MTYGFKKYLVVSLSLLTLLSSNSLSAHESAIKKASLSISGSHAVVIEHDQATIEGSVETFGLKAKDAVQDNAKIIETIRQKLKQADIDPKKLISKGYNLNINYDYQNDRKIRNKKIFRDYQVTHKIAFTSDAIKDIGKIADILISAGTNHISQIRFTSSKIKEAYDIALKKAVLDAKTKAELAISGIDNMSIGKAISIQINPSHYSNPPVFHKAMESRVMMSDAVPTSFQTEGQKVTVNVQTLWEIITE
ncbi:MAG: hypothetical protein ACJARD_001302 [Alphaproteobacteria bacterium]|jgi:uncharacterized protein YggE